MQQIHSMHVHQQQQYQQQYAVGFQDPSKSVLLQCMSIIIIKSPK
jgi:hypothetical protein